MYEKNKYTYTIMHINLQSNFCNSNVYTWHIENAMNATILAVCNMLAIVLCMSTNCVVNKSNQLRF